MIHLGLETLLTIGHKSHCLWLMLWRVLGRFPKCQEKSATNLVDEAFKISTEIV